MNDEFIEHALSNGDDGAQWLQRIPDIIAKYEKLWSVKVALPFTLSYNYVAPAVRADGSQAVVKIGYPKDREFQTEIEALTVFNGVGAEKLLEVDKEDAVILIERVTPGLPLSSIKDDENATRIMAFVMKKLRKPAPGKNNFISIREWTKDLFQVRDWYKGTTGPFPEELINKAQEWFDYLIESQEEPVLVHGDLHHDNILSSDRDGWLAIDPKGILAEPCYEVAAMIRNPYEKLRLITDLKPLLYKRILILSHELKFDARRIHQWCLAQTVLSAVWNTDGYKGGEHALRIAQALNELHFS